MSDLEKRIAALELVAARKKPDNAIEWEHIRAAYPAIHFTERLPDETSAEWCKRCSSEELEAILEFSDAKKIFRI